MNEKPCIDLETSVPGRSNIKGNGSEKRNDTDYMVLGYDRRDIK